MKTVFLPAAKPTCNRTVRVFVVVGLLWGHDFEGTPKDEGQGQLDSCGLLSSPYLPPKIFFGRDPSRLIKICHFFTWFLFGAGSIKINQDLSLLDQIFSSGWDPSLLNQMGGIFPICIRYILWHLSEWNLWLCIKRTFDKFISNYNMLSRSQFFEESLFLFHRFWKAGLILEEIR